MSSAAPGYPSGSVPPADSAHRAGTETGPHAPRRDEEIRVYGHCNLFYWWPVWSVCFLMAALTFLDRHVMAIVPLGTKVEKDQVLPGDTKPHEILAVPPGQTVPPARAESADPNPHLRVAANNNYGVVFVGILLFVVLVTNMTLRGQASVIAVALLIIAGLVVALFGWWDEILRWIGGFDVRMNAGGYLAIGIPLLVIWLFSTFVYDRYTYLIVTRGQVRICKAIGDGELAIDSAGLLLEKKRNDLFRHWLLGLGSGDLHVKTGGPSNLDFQLYNVLFIGSKIERVQTLLREKEVSEQPAGA
jgi:hypothetical protein